MGNDISGSTSHSDFSHSDGYAQSIQTWKHEIPCESRSSASYDSSPNITYTRLKKPDSITSMTSAPRLTLDQLKKPESIANRQHSDYVSDVKAISIKPVRTIDRIATPSMRAKAEVQRLQAAYDVRGHRYTSEYRKVEAECKEKIKKSTNPEFKRILQKGIDDGRVHFIRSDPGSGATQLVESNPRGDISVSTHTVNGLMFQTISVKDHQTTLTYHFPLSDKPLYEKKLGRTW